MIRHRWYRYACGRQIAAPTGRAAGIPVEWGKRKRTPRWVSVAISKFRILFAGAVGFVYGVFFGIFPEFIPEDLI